MVLTCETFWFYCFHFAPNNTIDLILRPCLLSCRRVKFNLHIWFEQTNRGAVSTCTCMLVALRFDKSNGSKPTVCWIYRAFTDVGADRIRDFSDAGSEECNMNAATGDKMSIPRKFSRRLSRATTSLLQATFLKGLLHWFQSSLYCQGPLQKFTGVVALSKAHVRFIHVHVYLHVYSSSTYRFIYR